MDIDDNAVGVDHETGFSARDVDELLKQLESRVEEMKQVSNWGDDKAKPEQTNDTVVGYLFEIDQKVNVMRKSGEIDREGWSVASRFYSDEVGSNIYKVSNFETEPGYVITMLVKEDDLKSYQITFDDSTNGEWNVIIDYFKPSYWSDKWYVAEFLLYGRTVDMGEWAIEDLKRHNRVVYMMGGIAAKTNVSDEVKMSIGSTIYRGLSFDQISEFRKIVDGDDDFINTWLASNRAEYKNLQDYKSILRDVLADNQENVSPDKVYAAWSWIEVNSPGFSGIVTREVKEENLHA